MRDRPDGRSAHRPAGGYWSGTGRRVSGRVPVAPGPPTGRAQAARWQSCSLKASRPAARFPSRLN